MHWHNLIITPTLDFELDSSIQQLDAITKPFTEEENLPLHPAMLYTIRLKKPSTLIETRVS
jgi:hypothetical protein